MKQVLFSVVLIILLSDSGQAQGWRGIVPLRSNCESVKGLLKVDRCTPGTYLIGEDNYRFLFPTAVARRAGRYQQVQSYPSMFIRGGS